MNSNINDFSWFTQCLNNDTLCKKLSDVKMVICDVDGTLTNGTIDYTDEHEYSRAFSILDGFAIVSAQKSGLLVGLLSGKAHGSITIRAKKLGIPDNLCAEGKEEKIVTIREMAALYNIPLSQILLIGDDFFDIKVKLADPTILFATLQDAPFYFHHFTDVVIPRNGGHHAVRLMLDLVLYLQKKHFAQTLIDQTLNERS